MKKLGKFALPAILIPLLALAVSCREHSREIFITVDNGDGPVLGYSPASGVALIRQDGYYFKDLDRNGRIDPYEDWRLDPGERAADLAARLSAEQIAGLMLFSPPQTIPSFKALYGGLPLDESGADAWELTDTQKQYAGDNGVRHFLIAAVSTADEAALWNNNLQAYAEAMPFGIPCNTAIDPLKAQSGIGGQTSGGDSWPVLHPWPAGLALGATFDPGLARRCGEAASERLRAMGISTVLAPNADLGTEPRWAGIGGTFGEGEELVRDMVRAYVDGLQSSAADGGWGAGSVNAMVGHWPGGGTGEAGRDGHYAFGKFAVYPSDNFDRHLRPFTEGAFALDGGTQTASAVMPAYNVAYGQSPDTTEAGSAFSKYMITDLLRNRCGYDGVVCTDWGVTWDEGVTLDIYAGKPWGAEELTPAERCYRLLMAGVDQIGGLADPVPLMEAYRMGCAEHGEQSMRGRFEASAVRILRNMIRVGLFENPYADPAVAAEADSPGLSGEGYDAGVRSVVLMKNSDNVLPATGRQKVYVPESYYPAARSRRGMSAERFEHPVDAGLLAEYFDAADDPEEADLAIVFVNSPGTPDGIRGGYDIDDRTAGGNGYVPISLQYRPYTADSARMHSIAAGDPVIDPIVSNRSYWEKTVTTSNEKELDIILKTHWKMNGKPVIVVVNITRPMVFSEFEPLAGGILAHFGADRRAVLDIITGRAAPSGLLPLQMPADMITVELQDEDRPLDMECHTDTDGNAYDFGFGLDWNGVIEDGRTEKYKNNSEDGQ